jgi:hypothetical protein
MSQERRDRMTETFAAVRDALQRAVVPTFGVVMDAMPDLPRPWYLPEIQSPPRAAARAQVDALIARGRRTRE